MVIDLNLVQQQVVATVLEWAFLEAVCAMNGVEYSSIPFFDFIFKKTLVSVTKFSISRKIP